MTHARAAIRAGVVTALKNASTLAGARVYDTPYDARTAFPSLMVEDHGEQIDVIDPINGPSIRRLDRSYQFIVTAEIQQNSDVAATRDTLTAQVEACLCAASLPGVRYLVPRSYQTGEFNDGSKAIRLGHLLFEARYATLQADPSTAFPV